VWDMETQCTRERKGGEGDENGHGGCWRPFFRE